MASISNYGDPRVIQSSDVSTPPTFEESIEFISRRISKLLEEVWLCSGSIILNSTLLKLESKEGAEKVEQAIEMLKSIRCGGEARKEIEEIIDHLERIESLMELPHTSVLTQQIWLDYQEGTLPPYPLELKEFIEEDCTIWPGKKRYETHIVFPIFSEVSLEENASVPLNLGTLDQLDGHAHIAYFDNQIDKAIGSKEKFCWAAMTYDIIPESRGQSSIFLKGEQQWPENLDGYEIPSAFEAALGLLWHYRRTNKSGFASDPDDILTCCREGTDGDPITVGAFGEEGLCITTLSDSEGKDVGVAVLRKFPIQMPAEH